MTQSELDAALDVAWRALDAHTVMGMRASRFITKEQLSGIVQDALQAAEDVRRERERGARK